MAEPQYPLYELSSEEFEKLCIDLVFATDPSLSIANAASLRSVDAVGTRATPQGSKSIAVEVKHRSTFQPDNLRLFLGRLAHQGLRFDEFIFITSAPIDAKHQKLATLNAVKSLSPHVRILGQQDVIGLLNSHPAIAAKHFNSIRKRIQRRKISLVASSATLFLSVGLISDSLISFVKPPVQSQTNISTQIKSVEESLSKLTDLEKDLRKLKEEIQEKSKESARAKAEYEEAMKLKAITAEQLEQVRKAVAGQSRWETFWTWFIGLLSGIAGSIVATIITDKYKQRKALARPISEPAKR